MIQGRYAAGLAGQGDVLRARVEAVRMSEETALPEQRRARQARLNEALDRPSESPPAGQLIEGRERYSVVVDYPRELRDTPETVAARRDDGCRRFDPTTIIIGSSNIVGLHNHEYRSPR